MKYPGTILYFAGVAVLAVVAYFCPPSSSSRQVLAIVAGLGLVGGVVMFEVREGWRSQRTSPRSRTTVLLWLLGGLVGGIVVSAVPFFPRTRHGAMLALRIVAIICLLVVCRAIGALGASRTQNTEDSEQVRGDG